MEQLRFQASADRGVAEVHPHPLAPSADSWDPVCLSLPSASKCVPHPYRAARRTLAIIMKSAKPSNTVPSQATAPRSWRNRAWALLLAITPLGAACDFIAQKDLTPGQSTEALDELGLDAHDPPRVGVEPVGVGVTAQQSRIGGLGGDLGAAQHHWSLAVGLACTHGAMIP